MNLASFRNFRDHILAIGSGFVFTVSEITNCAIEVLRATLRTLLDDVSQWLCFVIFAITRTHLKTRERGNYSSPRSLLSVIMT